jgi:hypothetical protein
MSLFDEILKKTAGSPDDVINLAAKVGIDPGLAEKAIAALGVAHSQQGDTIEGAAAKTGLDAGVLSQIVGHIGGEGSLAEYAQVIKNNPQDALKLLDRDGDGNPLNDLAGIAKGLFGKS